MTRTLNICAVRLLLCTIAFAVLALTPYTITPLFQFFSRLVDRLAEKWQETAMVVDNPLHGLVLFDMGLDNDKDDPTAHTGIKDWGPNNPQSIVYNHLNGEVNVTYTTATGATATNTYPEFHTDRQQDIDAEISNGNWVTING